MDSIGLMAAILRLVRPNANRFHLLTKEVHDKSRHGLSLPGTYSPIAVPEVPNRFYRDPTLEHERLEDMIIPISLTIVPRHRHDLVLGHLSMIAIEGETD